MNALSRMTQRTAMRLVLATASLGAGAIHLAFADAHYEEWRPLGVAFVAAGAFQVLWAVHVAVRDSRAAQRVGGLLSLVFIGTYLMSRTTGLPLGPEAFTAEPVGLSDLLCCALEVPVALGALLLSRRPRFLAAPLGRGRALGLTALLLLCGSVSGTALASPAHVHGSPAAPCPSAPVLTGETDSRGVDTGVTAYFSCRLLHVHDGAHHASR
jgi:hypothetical protein